MPDTTYGSEYGVDIKDDTTNIGGGTQEHVFDPTAGGTYIGGGNQESVFDPTYGGTLQSDGTFKLPTSLSDIKKWASDNAGLLGLAGAAAGLMSSNQPKFGKTGYQGSIPTLLATRNMITAPPTGRRAGAGGVNYGGDVTYTRAPAGTDPWVNLRGDSAFITDPQGQANVLKGTGADTQSMANKIGYNLPGGWDGFSPQQKIAWFNQNNVSYDQLLAAGVPQSDIDWTGVDQATIDWMKQNGYGKAAVTTNTVTGGTGIDALVAAQNKAQTQADKVGLNLPSDWSTYDAAKKIDWFNRNGITSKQLLDAGVDQGDINWMQQHGFATESTQPVTSNDTGTGGINTNSAVGGGSTSGQKGNIPPASEWNSYTPAQKIDFFNRTNTSPADLRAKGVDDDTINWMMQNGYNPQVSAPEEIPPSQAKTKQSAGLMSAINQGMTQDQYIGNIKDWLNKNSTASDAEVYKQMKEYGIGAEDVASALGVPVSTIQGKINALTQQGDISPAPFIQPDSNLPPKVADQSGGIKNIMDRALGVPVSVIQSKIDALGVNNYASGGMAKGRYLQGETDGMADEIPAQIGRDQPAALSHGEFVVPADVVSHLGNGNSDAGAKKLYQMMDKIRMARTGTKKQGKKINPDKFMPGGLAQAYANGGAVKRFQGGGTTGTPAANLNAGIAGVESSLSNWAGDYTTNMLGQGQALANMPYQAYMGPLTAGPSALQNKVSEGLGKVNFPGVLGQSFTSAGAPTAGANGLPSGGGGIASAYMNPYLQNVLQPQLEELRRQSQINLQPSLAKLTQTGGYGGGRQAIMESEANRNLLNAQNTAIGQGYASAFDKAQQQFNTEQGQAKTLVDMMAGQGATDRAIEAEGVAADKAAFEEARANPYKMVQFQQSLLQGLPLNAQSYTGIQQSDLVKAAQGATTVNQLLKNLGLIT